MWLPVKLNVLPMLVQLIGRSLHFNLHRHSLFEDMCDKDDCRYKYYWFLITYHCHQMNLQNNDWTLHWWVYPKTPIYRWTGLLWVNRLYSAQSSEINGVIVLHKFSTLHTLHVHVFLYICVCLWILTLCNDWRC